jgi:hypothetical protein
VLLLRINLASSFCWKVGKLKFKELTLVMAMKVNMSANFGNSKDMNIMIVYWLVDYIVGRDDGMIYILISFFIGVYKMFEVLVF